MAESTNQNQSTSAIKHLQTTQEVAAMRRKFFAESAQASEEGKMVAWCCVATPKEILQAMDVSVVYPENFAVVAASKRLSSAFCQAGERAGFSRDVCGYARITMGYVLGGPDAPEAPYGGMAKPDFLTVRSSACDSRMGWFATMSRTLELPLHIMDAPYQPEAGCAEAYHARYTKDQLEEFIDFVENQTGRKLDRDVLREKVALSRRAEKLQREITELRKAVPCPMGSADAYTAVWPGMYMTGTQECDDFYTRLKAEVNERIEKGIGIVEEEKFRIMWSGIPFWYNMRLVNHFEQFGGVVAIETTYFRGDEDDPPHSNDPVEDMSLRHTVHRRTGTGIQGQIDSTLRIAKEYSIDGVILSFNPSCRQYYIPQLEIKNSLEEAGIPTLSLECDMADERTYSEGQIMTRINGFIERLLAAGNSKKR